MTETLPTGIESESGNRVLTITWEDGSNTILSWSILRLACPCAQCREEDMESLRRSASDASVEDLVMIGHYAIQPVWADGHSTGIFTWEYLREIGEREAEDSDKA